jgi:hypothetical protein
MPARLRLSWGMKTFRLFFLPVLESLEFGSQVIPYGQKTQTSLVEARSRRST